MIMLVLLPIAALLISKLWSKDCLCDAHTGSRTRVARQRKKTA